MTIANMKRSGTYRAHSDTWGPWLAARIRDAGLTQNEFAAKIGVSSSTVSRWVSGRSPDASFLDAISDVLVLDYDLVATNAGYRPRGLLQIDPDSPTARLMPLIEKVNWDRYAGRLESLEHELRFMIESDRKSKSE